MKTNLVIPETTKEGTIETICINKKARTASTSINISGKISRIEISLQPLIDVMTVTQKSTISTFLDMVGERLFQAVDSSVIGDNITEKEDWTT